VPLFLRTIGSWLVSLALIVASITVTLIICEGIARLTIAPRTSGAGMGILHRHFRAEHGRSGGLLMQESNLAAASPTRPLFLFLGDSFTNGHGVQRHETFPSKVAAALGPSYSVFNLGRNGDNTQQELARLEVSLAAARAPVTTVVHQYLGNDIADWVDLDIASSFGTIGRLLIGLAEISYLADYLYQPFFLRSLGAGPVMTLLDAYTQKSLRDRHFEDIRRIWQRSHAAGASVILIVFPMPMGRALYDLSVDRYVRPVVSLFRRTCRDGDAVIDVSALIDAHVMARRLDHWVVSRVDAHPSAALHRLVAREIIAYVQLGAGRAEPCARGVLEQTPAAMAGRSAG